MSEKTTREIAEEIADHTLSCNAGYEHSLWLMLRDRIEQAILAERRAAAPHPARAQPKESQT
jgi:hypothetical protein